MSNNQKFWEERGKLDGILSVEPCAEESQRRREEKFRKRLLAWTTVLMQRAKLFPAKHLLDLGCGFGDISAHLAPHCTRVTSIDGSSTMVDQVNAHIARSGHAGWTAGQSDLVAFDRIESDVDVVYLGAVCMYLPEDGYGTVIENIAKHAAPNVTIVQREYVAMNGGWEGTTQKGDYVSHRRAAGHYIDRAAKAGFRCELLRYSSDMDIDLALGFLGPVGRGLSAAVRPVGRLALRGKKEGSSTFILRRN